MNNYLQFTKRNIRRTPIQAIAASMVMLLTFLALSIFLLLAGGSQLILRYYESRPQVIAFFKDGTTQQDVDVISSALRQDGQVSNIHYVSQQEALQIYKDRNKNDPVLLELVTANILPSSLEVSTQNPEDLNKVAAVLKKEPVVSEVIVPEDVVQTLTNATKIIRIAGGAAVAFLILFATLVTILIIGFKIRIKRDEIEIMRLIGASNNFIRMPFVLEGVFYGVVGAVAAWVISYALLWYFTPFVQGYVGEVQLLPINPIFMLILLLAELLIAVLIGGLGSLGAVRRYLHI